MTKYLVKRYDQITAEYPDAAKCFSLRLYLNVNLPRMLKSKHWQEREAE